MSQDTLILWRIAPIIGTVWLVRSVTSGTHRVAVGGDATSDQRSRDLKMQTFSVEPPN